MTPLNLLHASLAMADPTMLTSPDGKRIEINLAAIQSVFDNAPPMIAKPPTEPQGETVLDIETRLLMMLANNGISPDIQEVLVQRGQLKAIATEIASLRTALSAQGNGG